jgi:hypothetical protein
MVSIYSHNSLHDCDSMFIADFMKLDEIIGKLENDKEKWLRHSMSGV